MSQTPSVSSPPPHPAVTREDARAALGAFADLGPDYSDAVIDSFIGTLNERLATSAPAPHVDVIRDAKGNPVLDDHGRVQFYPTTAPGVPPSPSSPPSPPPMLRVSRGGRYRVEVPMTRREPRPISPFARQVTILSITLGAAIAATAIAAPLLGLSGLVVVWIGIVVVAITQAWIQK